MNPFFIKALDERKIRDWLEIAREKFELHIETVAAIGEQVSFNVPLLLVFWRLETTVRNTMATRC